MESTELSENASLNPIYTMFFLYLHMCDKSNLSIRHIKKLTIIANNKIEPRVCCHGSVEVVLLKIPYCPVRSLVMGADKMPLW